MRPPDGGARGCTTKYEETMIENRVAPEADVVLVGAGIMSATLAVFLKELEPSLNLEIFETLDGAAEESSDAWNNAGTGHAALHAGTERRQHRHLEGARRQRRVRPLAAAVVLPRDQGGDRGPA